MVKKMKNFEYFLMFTAGTGGHFIASQMCKNLYDPQLEIKSNRVNEWDADAIGSYCVTSFLGEDLTVPDDAKILLNHGWSEEQFNNSNFTFDRKIFVTGHGYTRLLTKIKKMYKQYNDDTISNMLESMLIMLHRNFDKAEENNKLPVMKMIDRYHKARMITYRVLTPIEDLIKVDFNKYVPTVYEYIMYATTNNVTPTLDGFKRFLGKVLIITSAPDPNLDREFYLKRMLGEHADTTEFMSYNDVFYNKTKTIPGLYSDAIDEYNSKNHEFVRKMLDLVDEESATQIVNNIHAAGIPFKR